MRTWTRAIIGTSIAAASSALTPACSSSSGPGATPGTSSPQDGGPSDAGNTLTGSGAFTVSDTIVDTQEAKDECSYETLLPDGSFAAFGIIMAQTNISAYCSADAAFSPPGGQPFVVVQVAGPSYSNPGPADGGGLKAITPGTYTVGFENVPDDDLCMLAGTGASALVDIRTWKGGDAAGAVTAAEALSGTVTITSISPGHVAGSFSVMMVSVSSTGQFDTQHPSALSGTFDSATCP